MSIDVEDKSEDLERPKTNPTFGDFVLGYAYFELPKTANVMMTVWDRDGELMACQRVRFYRDNKIYDSDDERHFVTFTPKEPTTRDKWWADTSEKFREMTEAFPTPPGKSGEPQITIKRVFGDMEKWLAMFRQESFVHITEVRKPNPN